MGISQDVISQAAAIPVRNGRVCLVNSRNGKRWVIPKGCLETGKRYGEIALQEAWEEAGLMGALEKEPAGTYLYEKAGNHYHVTVYLMHVTQMAEEWPERHFRTRRWLTFRQALATIEDRGLRKLLCRVLAKKRVLLLT
jgi:8-oxo-dGTP pyrophosphatase MutT (NUDIX family)